MFSLLLSLYEHSVELFNVVLGDLFAVKGAPGIAPFAATCRLFWRHTQSIYGPELQHAITFRPAVVALRNEHVYYRNHVGFIERNGRLVAYAILNNKKYIGMGYARYAAFTTYSPYNNSIIYTKYNADRGLYVHINQHTDLHYSFRYHTDMPPWLNKYINGRGFIVI
jgi:hypothetical protein